MNVLPVSTNPYTSLSANYPYDGNISFNPYFQQYNNGFYFFNHDIFKKVNDLSINKYNSLFLTDKLKATEILKDKKIEREEEFSNSFLNLYMFSNLNYASVQDEDENGIQYIFADKSQVSDASVFQIVTDSVNKKIWFIYNKAYYVQVEDKPPWKLKLYFSDGAAPENEDSYKFNYEKYEDNYVISTTYASRGVLKRYLKASPSEKYLGFYGTSLIDEGVQVGFNFLDFNFIPAVSLKGLNERSWFFSYYNKPVDFIENQTVNPNLTKSVSGVKQNFLITSPFQTKIKNPVLPEELDYKFKVSSFELNLASLKNVKNSNYEYSKLPYNLEPDENYDEIDDSDKESEFNKREYLKIFTGSNQEYGYEKPLLTYGVNNKSLSLLKDKTTFFHYPSTSPSIKLNDSGLKEAGAFPSTIPFFADKIFKKDAQYGKNVYWGDSTQFQNGQWLCSWLSGNGDTSVWMDRWYLPDQITTFAALTAFLPEPISCGINYANFNNVKVFDVESIMTFEPEVWYKYFHIGENFIQYAVDNIINYKKNYLKLHYENWNSSSIKDESENNPDGQYINFTNSSNFMINGRTQNIADLNGLNQYIFIPYSEKVKVENNNTFSIWAYSENWSEVKYSDIVSNGSSNYYNLKISNGLENPISVIYAKDQNKLIFFNNDNIVYAYVDLINENNLSNVENVCVDNKLNVWVLDKGLNFIYKISYSGVIELKIEFPASFNLSNITLNSKSEVNVVNKNTGVLSSIDLNGNVYAQNTNYIGDDFRIESSLNDAISGFECYKFLFDSNDYPWILSTDRKTLNRFETPVLIAEYEIDDFTIDNLNNIWVLFDNNKIYKLDSIGLLSLSSTIPLDNTNAPKGGITILNDYSSKTQKDENFILVSKNKFFYKYDNNLNYIKKYNTGVVPYENNYITPNTDWSGYDFGRKYIYLKDFNGVTNLQLSYSLFNNQLGVLDYKLFYPANKLNKGWHNFCGVYDNNEKTIKFYIDGELENRIINIPYDTIMNINLKNPTLLGNKMGLIVSFNEEITLKNKFIFKGKIDDFRVYNKSLSDLEVKLLYYLKLKFYDLKWHIPTGFQIYVEEIERFFKHKLTGSKSNLYNINIINYKTEDESVKRQIEEIIKETVVKIAPAYTQLYKINWTDEKQNDVSIPLIPPIVDFIGEIVEDPQILSINSNELRHEPPFSVNFTDLSLNSPNTWRWDLNGDGNVDSVIQNPIYTYENFGVYTVSLTASNDLGSDFKVKSNYISALPPLPQANFTTNPQISSNLDWGEMLENYAYPHTVNFVDESLNATEWHWDLNDDGIVESTLQNPSYTYTDIGPFTVRLTASNIGGSDVEIKEDFVPSVPQSPILYPFTISPTEGDAPLTITLSSGIPDPDPYYITTAYWRMFTYDMTQYLGNIVATAPTWQTEYTFTTAGQYKLYYHTANQTVNKGAGGSTVITVH